MGISSSADGGVSYPASHVSFEMVDARDVVLVSACSSMTLLHKRPGTTCLSCLTVSSAGCVYPIEDICAEASLESKRGNISVLELDSYCRGMACACRAMELLAWLSAARC